MKRASKQQGDGARPEKRKEQLAAKEAHKKELEAKKQKEKGSPHASREVPSRRIFVRSEIAFQIPSI